MRFILTLYAAVGILTSGASGLDIDRSALPLVRLTFPLDSNTDKKGPHEVIEYIIFPSGQGYSARQIWNEYDRGFTTGSERDTKGFALTSQVVKTIISAARALPVAQTLPPRNEQIIIEGTVFPQMITSSWPQSKSSIQDLLTMIDTPLRSDLIKHFERTPDIKKK